MSSRIISKLAGLSDILNTTKELPEILDYTFTTARDLVSVDQLVLFTVEPFSQVAKAEMSSGGSEWWRGIELKVGEHITGGVIANRQIEVINDLSQDPRRKYARTDREVRAMVSLPLMLEEKARGSLNVYKNEPHEWSEEEVDLLKIITSTAMSAFARSELKEMVRNRTAKMIYVFSQTLGAKTEWNKHHSERVTGYSILIARELGYNDDMIRIVRQTAMIHDVGKLYVGGLTLDKKGQLDEDELKEIRRHPEIGVNLIKNVDMEHCIPGVMYHHERMDGSGYPDGLTGDKIPPIARIIAVADAFDAMTSDRPYKCAMTPEDACEELKRCAMMDYDKEAIIRCKEEDPGKKNLFDRRYVEAFLKTNFMSVYRKKEIILTY